MGKRGPKSKRERAVEAYQIVREVAQRAAETAGADATPLDVDTSRVRCAAAASGSLIAICQRVERHYRGDDPMDPSTEAATEGLLRAVCEVLVLLTDPSLAEATATAAASKR